MRTNNLQELGMKSVCNFLELKNVCKKILILALPLLISGIVRAEPLIADDAETSLASSAADTPFATNGLQLPANNDSANLHNNNGLLVELKVYPNPIYNGQLIIDKGEILQRERVEIYDMSGTLKGVYFIADEKQTIINLSGLPYGMYLVRVGNRIARVLKQ